MVAWIKRREVADWARKIRSKKLGEHQYRKGYARPVENEGVEWDGESNIEYMWEQVKQALVDSAREVSGSVRVGGKNPKTVQWNNKVKAVIERKEAAGRKFWEQI